MAVTHSPQTYLTHINNLSYPHNPMDVKANMTANGSAETQGIHSKMNKLFPENQTVAALPITEYLDWAAHPDRYSTILAMPPIQRGFVWKPKQIQDLWDSLLRNMPIGSLLLKASGAGVKSGKVTSGARIIEENSKPSFHLMDGQQRTLAMLLGFPCANGAQHKLWVDFSEPGKNGSIFQLRVTTAAQPFGYAADGGRLSLHERREARIHWDNDDKAKAEKSHLEVFNDAMTRPWKAGGKRQEYLVEVNKFWEWLDTDGGSEMQKEVVQKWLMPNQEIDLDDLILERVKSFRLALTRLRTQWIAVIKIPDIEKQADIEDPSHDYLTILFDRISSNGTRLSPDDLLFSMIKQSWPEAHNIVYALQKEVGSLMKPTDFVMTAFRLAVLQSGNAKLGDPELNAKTFHRHLSELLGIDDSPGCLRKMIGNEGILVKAFKSLVEMIEYRGGQDIGIPKIMFPFMNDSMLQVILYWLICNRENSVSFKDLREEVIRFILFWFVCSKDTASAYKASRVAMEVVRGETGCFPGKKLYQTLTAQQDKGDSLFLPLVAPSQNVLDSKQFRKQDERTSYFFGDIHFLLYANFVSNKKLLLWFQRQWAVKKFGEEKFVPMAGQDEDNVPYDFDHLIPQSNWSSLFSMDRNGIKNQGNRKEFENLYYRRALGNSIGNYRVMDSSENRSRGDSSLRVELVEPSDTWEVYAINPADKIEREKWLLASPEEGWRWDDDRLLAFQYAVESRVLYLYNRYFEEVMFSKWVSGG
ncbi:hypothetical protein CEK71_18760 [Methylovulum psychrotolerans]|uniref:GmrSD restriction endonucleases N-terminal domain-containing protein n=2 Tax=Methylovulum psychrotolerans TaxID=1704499 RepID=A0A1Z4C353_9GAMM|nr:hypothetical protein CEK71_18760 [Methylovulum psychrotolerans]